MDANNIMTLINAVGFPIFCVLMLGLYIWKKEQAERSDRQATNDILNNFSLNLQANTQALQNLTDIIKDKGDK